VRNLRVVLSLSGWNGTGFVRARLQPCRNSSENDLSFRVRTKFQEFSLPRTRVPHISLVFREMWDSTELD
jgi:hypothetical protein